MVSATTARYEKKTFQFDGASFQKRTHQTFRSTLKTFKRVSRFSTFIKMVFTALILFELLLFSFFFSSFSHSSFFAVLLGSLFLTIFSYLFLHFYYEAKKPEQILELKEKFIDACRRSTTLPENTVEHHLTVAHGALRLISHLHEFESRYFHPPKGLFFLRAFMEWIGFFFHKEDVFSFKEMLFFSAIDEHIRQLRVTPTDLELHASLAHTYVLLSRLYHDYSKSLEEKTKKEELLDKKFQEASKRGIEEFKILSDYAPNDPWVHMQLAKSYSALKMAEEEAKEYEKVLEINPRDYDTSFRLGVLYFELGENAKALKIYEKLQSVPFPKARQLLSFYGAFKTREELEELE